MHSKSKISNLLASDDNGTWNKQFGSTMLAQKYRHVKPEFSLMSK